MKTYYLYRHIRLDKNEVFYIGIGTVRNGAKYERTRYLRAFKRVDKKRSSFWQRVVNKTDFLVEIILESKDPDFINKKETEFISLYGRRCLNSGTLVNIESGGKKGFYSFISLKAKQNMKKSSWVRGKHGKDHHLTKPVFVYSLNGSFLKGYESYIEAAKDLKIDDGNITQVLNGKCQQCFGMVFKSSYMGEQINPTLLTNKKIRPVSCFDKNNNFVKQYKSVSEAARDIKDQTTNISLACKNYGRISCKGFYFKYLC